MKKKTLLWIVGLILCAVLCLGVEALLPHSYTQKLEGMAGLVPEGEDDHPVFHLAGWDSAGDEYYEDEYYEDEYYEEEYDEEYEQEAYEEPVYQLSFEVKGKVSGIRLISAGTDMCDITVITPQGEQEYYLEEAGSYSLDIPFDGENDTVTVQFSDSQRIIERIQVIQKGGLNPYRLLLMFSALGGLYLLFTLRKGIAAHLEYGFLIVGIIAVIFYGVMIPFSTALWWDGAIHYEKCYHLGSVFEQMSYGMSFNEWLNGFSVGSLNYVVSGLSVCLGQLLGLSEAGKFLFDRAFSAILYLSVSFLAIRWAKRYKRTLVVTALMPVCLFLGVSYSYDISINAFSFLAFALILNEMCTPKEKLSLKNAGLITFSVVFASLSKAVYMPLLALMLLFPRTKFQCKKQHIAYKAGLVLVIVVVFAAFFLPMLSNPEVYTDSRGKDETSVSQLSFILNDFPGFIGMLISNIWNGLFGEMLLEARNYLAYLDFASNAYNMITLLFCFYIYVTDHDPQLREEYPKPLYKWGIGMICLGIIAMTYTVFYVTFTQTGGNVIRGVQFRYFLPLLPFLAVVIQPRGVENHMKKENDYFVILAFCLITNVIRVWQSVLNVYYL